MTEKTKDLDIDSPLGPPPPPSSDATTATMKANKGRDTGPELLARKALRAAGVPGYRLHWKGIPGRPDICYPGRKIAVFVHGCYWHRCPHCDLPIPKSHTEFWKKKFAKNVKRDEEKIKKIKSLGWKIFVIWECQLKDDSNKAISEVIIELKKKDKDDE